MSNYNQTPPNNFGPILNPQIQMTNSSFIKSEIERFENVHPSIYSIYELVDEIKDQLNTQAQIRDHVMIIEGLDKKIIHQKKKRFVFRFICEQSGMDIKS
jgi:hypothetical protein